jgi:hypothetical protein
VSAAKKPGASRRPTPTRKDKTRPVELIGLSAVFGVFTGLIVGLATREWLLAAIFFGPDPRCRPPEGRRRDALDALSHVRLYSGSSPTSSPARPT